jgi:ferredoxin
VWGREGQSLLDVVVDKDVPLDGYGLTFYFQFINAKLILIIGGACEGTLACSTCHVVLPKNVYDSLSPPVDEELDMLDLAFHLTDT